jgi:hypothetical protein
MPTGGLRARRPGCARRLPPAKKKEAAVRQPLLSSRAFDLSIGGLFRRPHHRPAPVPKLPAETLNAMSDPRRRTSSPRSRPTRGLPSKPSALLPTFARVDARKLLRRAVRGPRGCTHRYSTGSRGRHVNGGQDECEAKMAEQRASCSRRLSLGAGCSTDRMTKAGQGQPRSVPAPARSPAQWSAGRWAQWSARASRVRR